MCSSMILIPAISLASFQPGIMFPQMATKMSLSLVMRWRRRAGLSEQPSPNRTVDPVPKNEQPMTAQSYAEMQQTSPSTEAH